MKVYFEVLLVKKDPSLNLSLYFNIYKGINELQSDETPHFKSLKSFIYYVFEIISS